MSKALSELTPRLLSQWDLYLLPIGDEFLLVSPLRLCAARLNGAALLAVLDRLRGSSVEVAPRALRLLEPLLEPPVPDPPSPRSGSVRPPFLGIIPTRSCNSSCVYCGFGSANATGRSLALEMAAAAVDWMARQVLETGGTTLEIHFFGGEPLICPDVVETVLHRARAVASTLDIATRFEVSTNGVVDERMASVLADYFDAVILSLDGDQETHDRRRPGKDGRGTFCAASKTARYLGESEVELCLRACIADDNVDRMEEITEWYCDEFQPDTINFETLQPTPESEAAGLKTPDPYVFARHCVRSLRVARSRGVRGVYAASAVDRARWTFCPVGDDVLILSPDGALSSCYLLADEWRAKGFDFHVGSVSGDGVVRVDLDSIERLRRDVRCKPRCTGCFCRWTCAGGCHVNHLDPGGDEKYDDFCVQTRIITACSLLERLGAEEKVERLIASRELMETLARKADDRLELFDDDAGKDTTV